MRSHPSLIRSDSPERVDLRLWSDRDLFYAILNIETYTNCTQPAFVRVKQFLVEPEATDLLRALRTLDWQNPRATDLVTTLIRDALAAIPLTAPGHDLSESTLRDILMLCAPTAMLDGYCLSCVANASMSHTPIAAILHRIHIHRMQSKRNADSFSGMLTSVGIPFPDITSEQFVDNATITDTAISSPLFELCLSLFPRLLLPETLGFVVLRSIIGVADLIQFLHPSIALRGGASAYLKNSQDPGGSATLSAEAVRQCIKEHNSEDTQRRISQGFCAAWITLRRLAAEVSATLQSDSFAPRREMIRMIRRKAPFSTGYHRHLRMGEGSFEDLLVNDPEAFVDALSKSPFVIPGQADRSRLLATTTAFGGPMFRVFDRSELNILHAWINSLGADHPTIHSAGVGTRAGHASPLDTREFNPRIHLPRDSSAAEYRQLSARDLYYRLVNIDDYSGIRQFCLKYVTTQLRFISTRAGRSSLPERYCRRHLKQWFEARMRNQAGSYSPLEGPPSETREQLIHSALQLCPTILIDGAWLQKWGCPTLAFSPIGRILSHIYSDEIGNGDTTLNHPNIYRALIREMGIELPDVTSPEFSANPLFDDASFRTPLFWLCLSQFPRKFLPETLGLNLAIELSGVGGDYRTSREVLRFYGYSPSFVDIHNTIDNADTGHAGLALRAVQIHMDSVILQGDSDAVSEHWNRVRTGYVSSSSVPSVLSSMFSSVRSVFSLFSRRPRCYSRH